MSRIVLSGLMACSFPLLVLSGCVDVHNPPPQHTQTVVREVDRPVVVERDRTTPPVQNNIRVEDRR